MLKPLSLFFLIVNIACSFRVFASNSQSYGSSDIDAIFNRIIAGQNPIHDEKNNNTQNSPIDEETTANVLNVEENKVQVKRQKKEKDMVLIAKIHSFTAEEKALGSSVMFRVKNLLSQTKYLVSILENEIEGLKIPLVIKDFEDFKARNIDYIITGTFKVVNSDIGKPKLILTLFVWDVYEKANILEHEFVSYSDELPEFTKELATQIYEFITGEYAFLYGKLMYTWKPVGAINPFKKVVLSKEENGSVTAKIFTDGKNITFNPRYCKYEHEVLYVMQTPKYGTQLYIVNRLNGKTMTLYIPFNNASTVNSSRKIIFSPEYSKDCKRILFSVAERGSTNIYLYNLNDYSVKKLTGTKFIETSAKFFDDDKKIIFVSDRSGRPKIWIMNSDGTKPYEIKGDSGSLYFAPIVSFDGKKIAFAKSKSRRFHLGIMNIDGSDEKILYSGFLIENPRFTPIGKTILFSMRKYSNSKSRIYSISPTSLELEEMPALIGNLNEPLWVDEF
jgi:TolB protein